MNICVYMVQLHKEQKLAWLRSTLLTIFCVILRPRKVDSWEFCVCKDISVFIICHLTGILVKAYPNRILKLDY